MKKLHIPALLLALTLLTGCNWISSLFEPNSPEEEDWQSNTTSIPPTLELAFKLSSLSSEEWQNVGFSHVFSIRTEKLSH